ncbi:MAG: response regulator [Sulfuriflexus sp.]|nr:response regulator [Sulfuriflexus sp.]
MNNLGNKSILLVDDDEVFRETLTRALERNGITVHGASNISHAIAHAAKYNLNIGIIDLCIGDESGLQLIQQLIQQNPDIRLVVLTGFASIATAVEAIKLGAKHYLTKPANVNEIIDALYSEEGNADVPTTAQPMSVKKLEWEHIQKVLAEHHGNVSATARAMGMHRRTLQRKLQKKPVKS